jgi:hypothetical protein
MTFDLAAAIKEGQADLKNNHLGVVILGSSGAGKSRMLGTFGVRTMFLYTSGESHGPASAASGGSEIVPICLDRAEGKELSADQAYERLLAILNDEAGLKKLGIKAIAIDGATEIENMIVNTTKWETAVQNGYKGNKSFAGPVTLSLFRPVINALNRVQKSLGIPYAMSCILDVKSLGDDGGIAEAGPKLRGFDVATGVIQQFADIVVLGQMSNGEKVTPRVQLNAGVSKSTKDFNTKEVRKLMNFFPRLTGANLDGAPSTLKPDLSRLVKIKADGKYTKEKKDATEPV